MKYLTRRRKKTFITEKPSVSIVITAKIKESKVSALNANSRIDKLKLMSRKSSQTNMLLKTL